MLHLLMLCSIIDKVIVSGSLFLPKCYWIVFSVNETANILIFVCVFQNDCLQRVSLKYVSCFQ